VLEKLFGDGREMLLNCMNEKFLYSKFKNKEIK